LNILFTGNQGGNSVLELHCAVAKSWVALNPENAASLAFWFDREAERARALAPFAKRIFAYETFLRTSSSDWESHVDRIVEQYPEVNWAGVIASERSFTDTSFLLGAGGDRREDQAYVSRITIHIVRFFEALFAEEKYDAVFCQSADSFFTHVLFKVARHHNIRILAITQVALAENGQMGFCLADDEYTHTPNAAKAYHRLRQSGLTADQADRAERYRNSIVNFDVGKTVQSALGRQYIVGPLSPNLLSLPKYLASNWLADKELDYRRFSVVARIRSNVLRVWRRWRTKNLLGSASVPAIEKYVLLALHFQPEQSTLVGGLFYANQVALAASVANSMPLGWTLIIKEHPKGRGSRPAWQYRYLASLPNVQFSDAPTKTLLRNAGATVTITGTIAIEAMAFDRPAVLMGQAQFDYADVLFRPRSTEELPGIFHRILVQREYERNERRRELIDCFFVSYLQSLRAGFPSVANADKIAAAIEERDANV
jgi:hypothetical protein